MRERRKLYNFITNRWEKEAVKESCPQKPI